MRYEQISLGQRGETVTIPIPESYADSIELVRSDLFRQTGKRLSVPRIVIRSFFTYSVRFHLWLRLAAYRKGLFNVPCRLIYRHIAHAHSIHLPACTKLGFGLWLGHYMNLVVNADTVIGSNVNLSQFTNIGSNRQRAAVIGDYVYCSPMVCIVDEVCIGHNATVGAGAVVTHDVPDGVTVAGVPARPIPATQSARHFIGNPYSLPWEE